MALLVTIGCVVGSLLTLGAAQMALSFGALSYAMLGVGALSAIPAWRKEVAPEARGWEGFKRTLSDYTRMKGAPDDFSKWDVYYCYAAALGVVDKYLKNMKRAAPQRGDTYTRAPLWLGYYTGAPGLHLSDKASALGAASASAASGGSVAGGGGGGVGSSGGR